MPFYLDFKKVIIGILIIIILLAIIFFFAIFSLLMIPILGLYIWYKRRIIKNTFVKTSDLDRTKKNKNYKANYIEGEFKKNSEKDV